VENPDLRLKNASLPEIMVNLGAMRVLKLMRKMGIFGAGFWQENRGRFALQRR
jgi:hypothetical protein